MHVSLSDSPVRNNRVLVIDANPAIPADIRRSLCLIPGTATAVTFVNPQNGDVARKGASFMVDHAHEGREGLEMATAAVASGQPYAMAFVDACTPPDWDGMETVLALWKLEPSLQIVICTSCSDLLGEGLLTRLGNSDRLVILKKPFDAIEVLQLATALTEKWNLLQQAHTHAAELEQRVRERTIELQASNLALQREIMRRMTMEHELNRAKNAAESADRAKSAFLANMSHEIRTPMNGVIGMANLLLASPLNAYQRDLAETLGQSGEALLTILNDVLDFSKIEAGRLELEAIDFDLAEQLACAVDLHADAAARKSLELVMQIDPAVPSCVRGDPVRLRQVILNLLGNAIKFTSAGEVVLRVTVAEVREGKTKLCFEVRDTGIGISTEAQASLFQPFVQADTSTTRRFGGSGLGLAICKRIVELMHGEIGLESTRGHGSTFWFTAEFDPALEQTPALILAPSLLENHHALIVDDNATNRKLLQNLCSGWRLRHGVADGALSALDELRAAAEAGDPYDLVILDHHMPDIDGPGLAERVIAERSLPRPILVLLTSRGERLEKDQMLAHGIAACELKPLHPEKLRVTLTRIMASRSALAGSFGTNPPIAVSDVVPFPGGDDVRILVAEDNPVNQKVTVLQLRNLGYRADVVANGREAIEALQRHPYTLVLMDAQMPELDGITATREIRAAHTAADPRIPSDLRIIAMTANAMAGDRELCLEAGMDDYLAKPVKTDALQQMLERYLPRGIECGQATVSFRRHDDCITSLVTPGFDVPAAASGSR